MFYKVFFEIVHLRVDEKTLDKAIENRSPNRLENTETSIEMIEKWIDETIEQTSGKKCGHGFQNEARSSSGGVPGPPGRGKPALGSRPSEKKVVRGHSKI